MKTRKTVVAFTLLYKLVTPEWLEHPAFWFCTFRKKHIFFVNKDQENRSGVYSPTLSISVKGMGKTKASIPFMQKAIYWNS